MPKGFVTNNRYDRVLDLPLNAAQTELRRGGTLVVARIPLARHQRLELRMLSAVLVSALTPGVKPEYFNTALGSCSVGLYRGTVITSPLAYAAVSSEAGSTNPFSPCIIETPGLYTVILSNNLRNMDITACCAGAAKLFY